jgi:hypothetical protein
MESKKTSKTRKKKAYSPTSDQSLLSADQDDYSVKEYVLEYTGMGGGLFIFIDGSY